jgi:hypothetical protein
MTMRKYIPATHPAVVPAKAGTHNPREWFDDDWRFGTNTARNR